jgi:hypothetical protein
MKRYTSFILLALIILPFTTNAFPLDDVVKQWMVYMRAKVDRLEKENAALKEQLKVVPPQRQVQLLQRRLLRRSPNQISK